MFRPLTDGQAMYEIGPPCSSDANCTLYTPATCNLIDRLCVWDTSTTNAPTTSAPTPLQSSTSGAIPSTSTTVHSQSTTTTRNAHVNPGIQFVKLTWSLFENFLYSKSYSTSFIKETCLKRLYLNCMCHTSTIFTGHF